MDFSRQLLVVVFAGLFVLDSFLALFLVMLMMLFVVVHVLLQ